MDPVSRIALVGCGAVVEQHYLPALRFCTGVSCETLVDPERARVEQLAARHGIPHVAASLDEVPVDVQGAVIAVPNDLHLKVVTDALQRGFHVLCEKPLGRDVAEVQTMVTEAADANRGLFAGMICRRYPAIRQVVKHRMHELVGDLQHIAASYGFPLDWPVKSPSFYDKARSGGGSLLDFGAHLVDALLYVLGHPVCEVVEYRDDADAGVEAEAEGRMLVVLGERRVQCTLRASRLRKLPNALVLRGTAGTLEIPFSPGDAAMLICGNGSWPVTGDATDIHTCLAEQLDDFGRAIRGEPHELPAGVSQLAAIGLVQRLYAARQPLTFAWEA